MIHRSEKVVIGLAAVILLGIAALFDLQISQTVADSKNGFGLFFEAFGELPGILAALFCAAALLATTNKPKHDKGYLPLLGIVLLWIILSVTAAALPVVHLKGNTLWIVLTAVVYGGVTLLLGRRIDRKYRIALRRAAVIGLLTFFAALLIVNLIKLGWGRERFRSMVDPIKQFTPWYLPQGLASGDERMSFPSGHSANAAVFIWIILLPTFIPKLSGKEIFLKVCAYLWILLVMASRVIAGAHFLSDVTMGALITIVSFYFLCRLFRLPSSPDTPVKDKDKAKFRSPRRTRRTT